MTTNSENILKAVDEALKTVNRNSPLSPDLFSEACAKLKEGATKSEVKALDAQEPARQAALAHKLAHARGNVKPEWLRRKEAAAGEIAQGKPAHVKSRAEIDDEYRAQSLVATEAGLPAATIQCDITRTIMFRIADKVEAAADELSNFATTPLAKLMLTDLDGVRSTYRQQAQRLRGLGKEMSPTIYFDWRRTLSDFGIPF